MLRRTPGLSRASSLWPLAASLLLLLTACPPSPPPFDAGMDAMDAMVEAGHFEAGTDAQLLGRVCTTSAQCDDDIPCTDDTCGTDGRCQSIPNNGRCDDGVFCNGPEACDVRRGCVRGEPITCDDDYVCTMDRCVETPASGLDHCTHAPLDRDGDGDADDHCHALSCGDAGVAAPDTGVPTTCWVGGDCDDNNPLVNSATPEICGDGVDNNCNGVVDESPCVHAPYDRCDAPLDVSAGGTFALDLTPAMRDYTLPCASGDSHDLVATFHLAAPHDVAITASSTSAVPALALQTACGSTSPADTVACNQGFPAQIRVHSLPAGDYFVLIATSSPGQVTLQVVFTDATPQPGNDTCATAQVIPTTGATISSDLIGAHDDVSTRCGGISPDVVYTFTLDTPMDVTLDVAGSHTDYFQLSIVDSCVRMPTTLRCDSGSPVSFTSHQLAAGTYFVIVESATPVAFTLQATFDPPTPPAMGDTCASPLVLTAGAPVMVSSSGMQNDYALTCQPEGLDTVFQFTLTTRQDVIVDVAGGASDFFSVAIDSTCGVSTSEHTCVSSNTPRAFALSLDPGTYYAIVKPLRPTTYTVTLSTYAPVPTTMVSGNDTCASAFAVTPGRAYLVGTTAPLHNDYNSPCAGSTPGNDAVFSLHLASSMRTTVVTDTGFFHVVWIASTTGGSCPGDDPSVTGTTCTLGTHSMLDAVLDAGDYFIILDGYLASYSGTYSMIVQLSPPP